MSVSLSSPRAWMPAVQEVVKTTDTSKVVSYAIDSTGYSPKYPEDVFVVHETAPSKMYNTATGEESWSSKKWELIRIKRNDMPPLNVTVAMEAADVCLLMINASGVSTRRDISGIQFKAIHLGCKSVQTGGELRGGEWTVASYYLITRLSGQEERKA